MATAVFSNFSPNFVEEVKCEVTYAQRRKIAEHKCRVLAGKMDRLTNIVKTKWDVLEPEEKESLEDLAYTLTNPPKLNFLERLKVATMVAVSTYRAGSLLRQPSFQMLMVSIDKLVDSILSAIERESLASCDVDFEALDSSYSEEDIIA